MLGAYLGDYRTMPMEAVWALGVVTPVHLPIYVPGLGTVTLNGVGRP